MNNKRKKVFKILLGVLFAVIIFVVVFFFTFGMKNEVVLEAGNSISIKDFYKHGFILGNVKFLSNLDDIDTNKVNDYSIKIEVRNKSYSVPLKIVDTTKPKVKFKNVTGSINYVPNPDDFIQSKKDYSEMTVSIVSDITTSALGQYQVDVKVSDAYSNSVIQTCTLNISVIKEKYDLELGSLLKKSDLLFDSNYEEYIKDEDIEKINNGDIGEYEVKLEVDNSIYSCIVSKKDTSAPNLVTKDVVAYINDKLTINNFIQKVSDYSSYTTSIIGNLDTSVETNSIISITATDMYGNSVKNDVKLTVKKDNDAPGINGLSKKTVNKYSKIDYYSGVSCYDQHDGSLAVKLVSGIDTSKYGTQYATYSCTDKSGNNKTSKREFFVNHDATDTKNKVITYANKAGSDPRSILYYLRTLIKYSTNWGGDDPVWFGLTNFAGNCYVHAMVYKQILDYKGYNTKLIWVTDKSHYWVLVQMEGTWKHCDPTPGPKSKPVTCVDDTVRYANLQGRNWDRSAWPEAK